MITKQFRNALELGEFLRQYFEGPFFSYGTANELVMRDEATNKSTLTEEDFVTIPAIKPRFFFRGQIKAYDWLLPNLFRDYAPLNKFSLNEQLVLRDKDASHTYTMPNPYFRPALAAEMHFSRMKCLEIETLLASTFATFERPIDVGALCQHYGLRTPLLDFTESVDVALFFATHKYANALDTHWIPCDEGVGVIYMLESHDLPDMSTFYEIGIQPLPRPFAQRASALLVEPGVDLLNWPALQAFCFPHNQKTSAEIGAQYDQGRALFPDDPQAVLVTERALDKHVSRGAYETYVAGFPDDNQYVIIERIQRLFAGRYDIRN